MAKEIKIKNQMENIDVPVVDKYHSLPPFYFETFHRVDEFPIRNWVNNILDQDTYAVFWVCQRKTSEFPVYILSEFINKTNLGDLVKNPPKMNKEILNRIKQDCSNYKITVRNSKYIKTHILNEKAAYGAYPVFIAMSAHQIQTLSDTRLTKTEIVINDYFANINYDIVEEDD